MSLRLSPGQARSILRTELRRLAPALGLKPASIQNLVERPCVRSYAAGEVILPAEAQADGLGLLVAGRAAVYTSQWRGRQPVAILHPGEVFGQALLLGDRRGEATLRARTPCEIWFLCRADLPVSGRKSAVERVRVSPWQRVSQRPGVLLAGLLFFLILGLPPVQRALAVVPLGLGEWCREAGHSQCAEQAWLLASELTPLDVNPQLALGMLYAEQGQLEAARQSFEPALALLPDSAELLNNLGFVYARRGDYRRAVEVLRRALEQDPGAAAVYYNLGLSLQKLRLYDEALTHYRAAMALGGPQAACLVNISTIYFERGELANATEAAGTALLYDDSLAPAYAILGAVALQVQQPQSALRDLRHAVSLDAKNSQANYYLGLTLQALNQTDEARGAFEQALVTAETDEMRAQIRRTLSAASP